MDRIKKWMLPAILLFLTGCMSYTTIELDVLEPAETEIPVEIASVVVVDNAHPFRLEDSAVHQVVLPNDEYLIDTVWVDDFGQLGTVFETAREQNASVVATRVFNSDDYIDAAQWLDEDESNTIILFHSTMYPYGIKLMQEYEGRISFDDPNVR